MLCVGAGYFISFRRMSSMAPMQILEVSVVHSCITMECVEYGFVF